MTGLLAVVAQALRLGAYTRVVANIATLETTFPWVRHHNYNFLKVQSKIESKSVRQGQYGFVPPKTREKTARKVLYSSPRDMYTEPLLPSLVFFSLSLLSLLLLLVHARDGLPAGKWSKRSAPTENGC